MESLSRSNSFLLYRALEVLFVCVAVFALSGATMSQTPSPIQAEEMKKLDFLVGEWKGEGSEFKPDGSRNTSFSQKTKVQAKDGNSALRIKDTRTYKPLISTGKNTVFTAGTPVFRSSELNATAYYDEKLKFAGEGRTPMVARIHWRRSLSATELFNTGCRSVLFCNPPTVAEGLP